jgi:hypothetical protein
LASPSSSIVFFASMNLERTEPESSVSSVAVVGARRASPICFLTEQRRRGPWMQVNCRKRASAAILVGASRCSAGVGNGDPDFRATIVAVLGFPRACEASGMHGFRNCCWILGVSP